MFPALALAAVLHRPELLVCAVVAEAERRGLDPVVVCALVEHESNFRPRARSATHDYGLMQIHEPIHGRHRAPAANIRKGVDILARALRREGGDMRRALSRYNTGRVGRRGLLYADRVLRIASRLRCELGEGRAWTVRVGSVRLWRSDCWCGLWSVDYDPRKRRGGKETSAIRALRVAVDRRSVAGRMGADQKKSGRPGTPRGRKPPLFFHTPYLSVGLAKDGSGGATTPQFSGTWRNGRRYPKCSAICCGKGNRDETLASHQWVSNQAHPCRFESCRPHGSLLEFRPWWVAFGAPRRGVEQPGITSRTAPHHLHLGESIE